MELNERLHLNGITELNEMQQVVGKTILQGEKDVVVLSPTGSGKTLAYLLPIVERIDTTSDSLQAVVIVPGRELALQSSDVVKRLFEGVRCYACYGGRMAMDEHRELRKLMPHIIFSTPGRLNDHLNKHNIATEDLKFVVIDEFDKCLQLGFSDEMQAIMQRIPYATRRILLSATDAEAIPEFVNMNEVARLNFLSDTAKAAERIDFYKLMTPEKDKLPTLTSLLRAVKSTRSMVFVGFRESVERIASELQEVGFTCEKYHGGLDQKQRERALYRFLNESANILICTDLASRGLDIPSVDNIIHYHLPENEDVYTHRIGRTARWKDIGKTFFLLHSEESLPSYVKSEEVETYCLPDVLPPPSRPSRTTLYIGKGKQNKISRADVLGFLCKKASLKSSEIGRIDVLSRYCYVAVDANKADQVLRSTNGEKIKGLKTVVELCR